MHRFVFALLPLAGGALVAVQAPMNARLRSALGSPLAAGFVSFAVGTVVLLALLVVSGGVGDLARTGDGPWWAYLGGVCGTVLVIGTLVAVAQIGVLAAFVAVIVGEVAMATLIDRFGWFQSAEITVSWERLAGIGLLLAGLALVLRRP